MSGSITVGGKILASHDNVSGKLSMSENVVFPAGHVLQISQNQFNTRVSRTSTSFGVFSSTIGHTITNCKSNSKIYIDLNLSVGASGSASVHCYFRLIDKTNNNTIIGTEGDDGLFGVYIDGQSAVGGYGHSIAKFNYLYTPPSFSNGSFEIEIYGKSHQETMYINRRGFDEAYGRLSSSIVLMEVAG
jgi:hypothetical protein